MSDEDGMEQMRPAATVSARIGKCADCRYFDPTLGNNETQGVCRRRAPAPEPRLVQAVLQYDDDTARWPIVLVDEWCGEFAEKAP